MHEKKYTSDKGVSKMDSMTFESRRYAILHKRICDNFSECPAKIACEEISRKRNSQPAIYMDENNKLAIDKSLCTGCECCLEKCGLFRIVTPYEERDVQKEFDEDPRIRMDFTVERFGCDVINSEEYQLKDLLEVNEYINGSQGEKINILEFIDESQVMCPFQAIDVDYIMRTNLNLGEYRKFVIKPTDEAVFTELIETFEINKFPAIILIFKGHILGTPITNEYRIRNENDRTEMKKRLQKDFRDRLEGR